MRARSIEITLTQGMDAMAEFAMAENPNVAERLALDPGAKVEFYEEYRRLTPIGYANALRALLAMDHITDELPRLRMPVLLIGGDRDPSLPPMKVIHRKIRGSKLVVLSPPATSRTATSRKPGTAWCSPSSRRSTRNGSAHARAARGWRDPFPPRQTLTAGATRYFLDAS